MNFEEYQRLALRTANNYEKDWSLRVSNWSMGLAGEAGEVVDYLKKVVHHGHTIDEDHIAKELGDVLWYVAMLADEFEIRLDDVAQRNADKLRARYPAGFSEDRSKDR